MISTDPWIWLSALLSICCFTLLYGDNKFFRVAEATYTASVVGHSVVTGYSTLVGTFTPLFTGARPQLIMSLILGILSLFVIWRKYAWVATVSIAVMLGVGTGLSLRTLMATDTIGNIRAVISEAAGLFSSSPATQLGALIKIVFTIAALFYFIFTLIPKGPISKPFTWITTLGKYALIAYIGISVGNTMQQFTGCATSAIYRIVGLWLGLG